MSAVLSSVDQDPGAVAIVGSGPVGIRVSRELLTRKPDLPLTLFDEEPWDPYDRVNLTSILSGDANWLDLENLPPLPDNARVAQHCNSRIVEIDRDRRIVADANGDTYVYSRLILATGSQAVIPDIPGTDLSGVYTLRNRTDVEALLEQRPKRVAVLGGGVLGLEIACALKSDETQVWVVQNRQLMSRQLDEKAGAMILEHLRSRGIPVILERTKEILGREKEGDHRTVGNQHRRRGQKRPPPAWMARLKDDHQQRVVAGIRMYSGVQLACDAVVLATGIKPRVDLALSAGLRVGRGIKVNDYMQTSDPSIYAIGECAEHRGRVYGLVAPGFEQAKVSAQHLLGDRSRYDGSVAGTELKGVDLAAFSFQRQDVDISPESQHTLTYEDRKRNIYRKIVVRKGKLQGLSGIGDWADAWRAREAAMRSKRLMWWQRRRFLATGSPWPVSSEGSVMDWPANAIVCNCMASRRGQLSAAIDKAGCNNVAALMETTGAGTGCGACRPLLAEMVGADPAPEPVEGEKPVGILSLFAFVLAIVVAVAAPIPLADTAQGPWRLETLWLDDLWKQVTGYTLLGLCVIAMLMSLRKRWEHFTFAQYPSWRVVHIAVGLIAIALLIVHTGLRLGEGLNLYLMVNFLALALLGAIVGVVTVMEGRIPRRTLSRWRKLWAWAHIVCFWPLPVLLTFHIVKVYYF